MASWWLWSIPQTLKPVYCYDVGTHTETNKRSVARFDVNLESLVILNVHPIRTTKISVRGSTVVDKFGSIHVRQKIQFGNFVARAQISISPGALFAPAGSVDMYMIQIIMDLFRLFHWVNPPANVLVCILCINILTEITFHWSMGRRFKFLTNIIP